MVIENNEDNLVLNNTPPDVREEFGITQREDEIDRALMPDWDHDQDQDQDRGTTNKNGPSGKVT